MNHPYDDPQQPTWITSSYSQPQANCVEVARIGTHLAIRDSKDPVSPHLGFDPTAWNRFLDSV